MLLDWPLLGEQHAQCSGLCIVNAVHQMSLCSEETGNGDACTEGKTFCPTQAQAGRQPRAGRPSSGTCRTNIAYILNNGKVFVSAFVEHLGQATPLAISVAAGATTTPDLIPNGAAAYTVIYQPRDPAVDYLALGLGTLMAAANTASFLIALNAMSMNPLVPAGVFRLLLLLWSLPSMDRAELAQWHA